MKLTKAQTQLHDATVALLREERSLSLDERETIYSDWRPEAAYNITSTAAFFTPLNMAYDLIFSGMPEIDDPRPIRVLDLCAGHGILSFAAECWAKSTERTLDLVCVETYHGFVEVGQRLLPQATWIWGNVFDRETWEHPALSEMFDIVISNPPFGEVGEITRRAKKTFAYDGRSGLRYFGKRDLMVADLAIHAADPQFGATMILPQMSCPFELSKRSSDRFEKPCRNNLFREDYAKWAAVTGGTISFLVPASDTSVYKFHHAAGVVEMCDLRLADIPHPATKLPPQLGLL